MFVKYIVRGDLGIHGSTQEFERLSWDEVEILIKNLDGEKYTYVIMCPSQEDSAEQSFGIRAAKQGVYVCNFYDGDEFYLINPDGTDLSEPLHLGEFAFNSTKEFTNIEDSIKAAKSYFDDGVMESTLSWEEL